MKKPRSKQFEKAPTVLRSGPFSNQKVLLSEGATTAPFQCKADGVWYSGFYEGAVWQPLPVRPRS